MNFVVGYSDSNIRLHKLAMNGGTECPRGWTKALEQLSASTACVQLTGVSIKLCQHQ